LIEEITFILNKEKFMIADEFVSFVHKIQDVTSLSLVAFEEESKSEVNLDWIWKNNDDARLDPPQPVNIPQLIVNILPVLPRLQTDSNLLDAEKHFNFLKNECFGGR
jgi:hypothetical protein